MNLKLISSVAAGAVCAAALTGAAGDWSSRAMAQPVNAPAAAPAAVAPASFADVVQRVAPAVVSIDMEAKARQRPAAAESAPFGLAPFGGERSEAQPKSGTGSGFFISADGYIVTNNHVVDGADKLTVRTSDGRSLTARLVGTDPETDLAVVKVEGRNFPYVTFEGDAKPRVGDWIIAVGNPFNLGGTATAGIVSAVARKNVADSTYVDYLQIDAPINFGNSGGPTFDVNGRVVGVNSVMLSPSGGSVGIGFAIPADVASSVAKQLISVGKVIRGYMGATVQPLTPEIAEGLGLPADQKGALVAELVPDGPAARAGLQPGDLILQVDGAAVGTTTELTRKVALAHEGEAIRLRIRRAGKVQDVVLHSGVRPGRDQISQHG